MPAPSAVDERAGQKWPAKHCAACALTEPAKQKKPAVQLPPPCALVEPAGQYMPPVEHAMHASMMLAPTAADHVPAGQLVSAVAR